MHPVLELRQIAGLEKDIVQILSGANGLLSQSEILRRLNGKATQPTLSRIMTRLTARGLIVKTGTTKNAAFGLAEGVKQFARPAHLRARVEYDPQRIGGYQPNITSWLSQEALGRMTNAAEAVQHQLDASTYSRQIAERFLIDLSWASSAMEGNTYDYLQTEALIKYGEQAQGHALLEATMILNHKRAITQMLEGMGGDVLTDRAIQRLHALLMQGLISNEDLGRIRANDVNITGTAYKPSADNRQLTSDFGSLLWKANQIENPFEASFFLLSGMSYLQAFVDGNKRVGRLTSNIPLLRRGLPPMSFIGTEKGEYLAGLIFFYETADTSLLSDVVSKGYEVAAPSYRVAVATQRTPRSIELRERQRIERAVQKYLKTSLEEGRIADIADLVKDDFGDISKDDLAVITDNISEALQSLNAVNSVVWNISAEDADKYIELRDNVPAAAL